MKAALLLRYDESNPVIDFAAKELSHYLQAAGVHCFSGQTDSLDPWLPHLALKTEPAIFKVKDPQQDDAYRIEVEDFSGAVIGANDRSVLLGSYRLLRELGYAFLRPDTDGERIPPCIAPHHIQLQEAAQNRYRGICIEGAVSFENILCLLNWMPKAGFNSYFTQFLTPYEFFKTWYEHKNNPLYPSEKVPAPEEVDLFVDRILVPEMKKRGLFWHSVGHGFNTETLGIRATDWDPVPDAKPPHEEWTALVDGKRGFFEGVPLNTNLCLSDPAVRSAFIDRVQEYLQGHPAVDVLHVWLADGGNNSCECAQCRTMRPSDWYILLLNELDMRLTAIQNPVKIAFLAYFDLLWPPQHQTLRDPDRFIFMFAPITRSYRRPLPTPDQIPLPPYVRNHAVFPVSAEENMRYARDWKKFFSGDSFVYDYHYMWNHFRDLADYASARLLLEDLTALSSLGFQGYISCQQTRVFAPTGLGMYVLGRGLWGNAPDFETLAAEYFQALFGSAGVQLQALLAALSHDSYEAQPENETEKGTKKTAAALQRAIQTAARIKQVRPAEDSPLDVTAWNYLHLCCEASQRYLLVLLYRQENRKEDAAKAYADLLDFLCRHEADWQAGFDVYWFVKNRNPVFVSKH